MERNFYIPKCTEPVLIVNENALRLIAQGAKSPLPVVNTFNHASVSKGMIINSVLDKDKKWHVEELQRYFVEFGDEQEYLFQLVSCGSCPTCCQKKQYDLVNRCRLESELYDCPPYFFTLTYAPTYLPYRGELKYTDIQRFWKRLRMRWTRKGINHNIRYLVAGEYGTRFGRPHYHVILWNNPYNCNELQAEHNILRDDIFNAWSMCESQSFDFGQCGDGAAAYAAKYAGKPKELWRNHWTQPFIRTSIGHGGLGFPYLAKYMDYYRDNPACDKITYTSKHDLQVHEINYGHYISTHIFPSPCRMVDPQVKSLYKQLTDMYTELCRLSACTYKDAFDVLEAVKPPYTRNKLSEKSCREKYLIPRCRSTYYIRQYSKVIDSLLDELSVVVIIDDIKRPSLNLQQNVHVNDFVLRAKNSNMLERELF